MIASYDLGHMTRKQLRASIQERLNSRTKALRKKFKSIPVEVNKRRPKTVEANKKRAGQKRPRPNVPSTSRLMTAPSETEQVTTPSLLLFPCTYLNDSLTTLWQSKNQGRKQKDKVHTALLFCFFLLLSFVCVCVCQGKKWRTTATRARVPSGDVQSINEAKN